MLIAWLRKRQFQKRLNRIAPGGRTMVLADDQGVEHGPRDFEDNPESKNPEYIINIAKEGRFTGVVFHAGIAEKFKDAIKKSGVPLILKVNGKSELYTADDPYSPLLYWKDPKEVVKRALALGATAIGYTVYSGSKYESEMNREFTQLVIEAHRQGVPVIGWMYPRGECLKGGTSKTTKIAVKEAENQNLNIDETPAIVAYAARLGLEFGADIVKVKYTGSAESFRKVVEAAWPANVGMAGGPKTKTDEEFLEQLSGVISAGGIGVFVGRNVWQRKDPLSITKKVREIIFK